VIGFKVQDTDHYMTIAPRIYDACIL